MLRWTKKKKKKKKKNENYYCYKSYINADQDYELVQLLNRDRTFVSFMA